MVHQKTTDPASILLMDSDRVQRSIHRMAFQIAEDNREGARVLILGIARRGYVVAKQLAACLRPLLENQVQVTQFLIDDQDLSPQMLKTLEQDHSYIVLVDDVIFSGQTILKAIEKILKHVTPKVLRTAVLVDRGHRNIPVEASFRGLEWPTKLNEHVAVVTNSASVEKVIVEDA